MKFFKNFDLYNLYISIINYNLVNSSSRMGTCLSNLVFLSRMHFASSVALISKRLIMDSEVLFSQMIFRMEEVKSVTHNSVSSGRLVSSRERRLGPVILGT